MKKHFAKKFCPGCNRNRYRKHFQRNSSRGDGLQVYCRDCQNLRNHYSREAYPEKIRAHRLVAAALRRGDIKQPLLCQGCVVNVAVDAHHDDYSKPLRVIWLCRSCHQKIHAGSLS